MTSLHLDTDETRGLVFHHVGHACADIRAQAATYQSLGFTATSDIFRDPLQEIEGQFWACGAFVVEVLGPDSPRSGLWKLIKRGLGMYHQAYLSSSFDKSLAALRQRGALPMGPAQPSVFFRSQRIIFLLLQRSFVLELIDWPFCCSDAPGLPRGGAGQQPRALPHRTHSPPREPV